MVERGGGEVQQETYMYWAHTYHAWILGSYCIHLILFYSQSIAHMAVIPSAQLGELRPTELRPIPFTGVGFKP